MARVVLGITGGIAAYKSADIARALVKKGIEVICVMTDAARQFITPLTLRTLTNNPVYCDMFHVAGEPGAPVEHIGLARNCDLILIAPATANVIGKIASGIADDLLTTTVMACEKKVMLAPAMNKAMWANPIVKENVEKLKKTGCIFIGPKDGDLACGEYGAGHVEDAGAVVDAVLAGLKKNSVGAENSGFRVPAFAEAAAGKPDSGSCGASKLANKTVLITSGPTREQIDDVRFISNPSSGKTGYFLAREAKARGAKVIFIAGKTSMLPDADAVEKVSSAGDMLKAAQKHFKKADIVIGAAAVGDFTVKKARGKIERTRNPELGTRLRGKTATAGKPGSSAEASAKAEILTLQLIPTTDILAELGKKKGKRFIVGFSAESGGSLERTKAKIKQKKLDMAIFNDITKKGGVFESDTNEIKVINKKGKTVFEGSGTKEHLAAVIMDRIEELMP